LTAPELEKVPLDRLFDAFLHYADERAKGEIAEATIQLPTRVYSVADKIESIQDHLKHQERIGFRSLLLEAASSLEIVVTFIAVLEMLKWGQIEVLQEEIFAEIYLTTASQRPVTKISPAVLT
jgi:chromatin segregation and condensation protein Rec8/ScpA/Scc1 (kleisin family)